MVLSRNIANLRASRSALQLSHREVYGYGTEPEHRKIAEQVNQHSSCCSGYDTEPGQPKSAEQANQHSSCCFGYDTELKNRKFAEQANQSLIVVSVQLMVLLSSV